MPKIRAALLSAPAASGDGLFLRIDELEDEAQLTDQHLPQITKCDLPPGRYRWIPSGMYGQEKVPEGGCMVERSIAMLARVTGWSIEEASEQTLRWPTGTAEILRRWAY